MKKKILYLFLSLIIALVLPFSSNLFAYANENEEVTPPKPVYYDLNSVNSILTDGTVFLVADETGLHIIGDGDARKISDTVISELCGTVNGAYALANGKIYSLSQDYSSLNEVSGVSNAEHIAYFNDTLYYSIDDAITPLSSTPVTANGKVHSLAVTDDLYYSVKNGDRYDIYSLDGELAYSLIKSGKIYGGGDTVYSVNKSGDLNRLTNDGELVAYDFSFVNACAGFNGGVCFATDDGELKVIENGSVRLVCASASSEDGFYNYPVDAISRFGSLFVSDKLNDRVAIVNDDSLEYVSLHQPSSIAVNNDGKLFVAHSSKQISVYSHSLEFEIKYELPSLIKSVCVDNDGSVYALSGGTVYSLESDGFVQTENTALNIYANDGLYLVKADGVYKNDELLFSASGIVDITCDGNGKIVALVDDGAKKMFVYDGSSLSAVNAENDLTNAVSVSFSRSSVGEIAYGDILLADNGAHKILIEKASTIGVSNSAPTLPTPSEYDQTIIRHTLYACSLYSSLNESDIALHLTKNRNIIVLKYDAYRGMSYCATENLTGELQFGFVFNTALSLPLEYNQPPAPEGTIYASEVNLYSLPSFDADIITTFERGDKVEMLDFATYSANGSGWYKVVTENETTGYVPSNSVSIRNFIPGDARPQYNAKIVSYKNSVCAPVYLKNSKGEYEQVLSEYLFNGTQVEIVGTFDESEKYAEIKYYDENLGTLTCFVEIVYLEYNSITLVQTIAIAVAVLTFILLVFLLIRLYMRNRKL